MLLQLIFREIFTISQIPNNFYPNLGNIEFQKLFIITKRNYTDANILINDVKIQNGMPELKNLLMRYMARHSASTSGVHEK